MHVTILDTVTGKQLVHETDYSLFYWTQGNGSCDCNRGMLVLGGDAWPRSDHCMGHSRFLITKHDYDYETPKDMNENYSEELLKAHGLI